MKNAAFRNNILALAVAWLIAPPSIVAQHCPSDAALLADSRRYPEVATRQEAIADFTRRWIADYRQGVRPRTVVTIPVVFHVVWREETENIPDAQLLSQLEVLNEDFRGLNDQSIVPGLFQDLIADVEIEFCLARRTPSGEPTDGVTRTQTTVPNVATTLVDGSPAIHYTDNGGRDAWDPESYLNIWIGRRQFFLGSAAFPAQGLAFPGEDGIVIDPRYVGAGGFTNPPYHLGHTLTHEVGHYFNLFHLWGPGGAGECTSDEVADTPQQSRDYQGECPDWPQASCATLDMFMNFMNFSDDACLAMFTAGQKLRMLAALNGPRSGLLASDGCLPPLATEAPGTPALSISPVPARGGVWVETAGADHYPLELSVWDVTGRLRARLTCHGPQRQFFDLGHLPPGAYWIRAVNRSDIRPKLIILVA